MAMEDADRPSAVGLAAEAVKCCRRLAASAATSGEAAAAACRSLSAREGSGSDWRCRLGPLDSSLDGSDVEAEPSSRSFRTHAADPDSRRSTSLEAPVLPLKLPPPSLPAKLLLRLPLPLSFMPPKSLLLRKPRPIRPASGLLPPSPRRQAPAVGDGLAELLCEDSDASRCSGDVGLGPPPDVKQLSSGAGFLCLDCANDRAPLLLPSAPGAG